MPKQRSTSSSQVGVVDEAGRVAGRALLRLLAELLRPEVGVGEAVDVPVEREPEPDVVARDVLRLVHGRGV